MFIEDLWEKFPEQTINAIKKIFDIREENGDNLIFDELNNGCINFTKYGHLGLYIYVRDFDIRWREAGHIDIHSFETINIKWMKFMKSVYGNKYLYQYISHRNQELDRFMANYEEKYNAETRKVLAELGMNVDKNQTK